MENGEDQTKKKRCLKESDESIYTNCLGQEIMHGKRRKLRITGTRTNTHLVDGYVVHLVVSHVVLHVVLMHLRPHPAVLWVRETANGSLAVHLRMLQLLLLGLLRVKAWRSKIREEHVVGTVHAI